MRQQLVKKKHKILRLIVKLVENFQCLGRILLVYALCKREQMLRSCDACGSPYGFLVDVGAHAYTLVEQRNRISHTAVGQSGNQPCGVLGYIYVFFFRYLAQPLCAFFYVNS